MSREKIKESVISESFILTLEVELEKNFGGISEYDLLSGLREQGYFEFLSSTALPHELFRAHFILYHTLYILRDKYYESKCYLLQLDGVFIQLLPYQQGKENLQRADKLRDYYLDLSNLEETSEDDVYDMLTSFWNGVNSIEHRETALTELGLKDPVNNKMIKETYRKLVMLHHPDRGGHEDKIQKINTAIKLLLG